MKPTLIFRVLVVFMAITPSPTSEAFKVDDPMVHRVKLLARVGSAVASNDSSPPSLPGNRIVNGKAAARGQFPFMAGIVQRGERRPFCGGSLITSRWVLTAAHCLWGQRVERLTVVLGEHRIGRREGEVRRAICRAVIHPHYEDRMHDLALVRLCGPGVPFSYLIQPIALAPPDASALPDGLPVVVAGWGTTEPRDVLQGNRGKPKLPPALRYVDIQIVGQRECLASYPWVKEGEGLLCAGVEDGGKDSCQGDSGGPLWRIDPISQQPMQVGVVSHGFGCAMIGFPGIYTDCSHHFLWILETMTDIRN